jgi:hypothetical protein
VIPDGWEAEENADLREGGWRFYRAIDPTFSESVSEMNVVTRDGERVSGPAGIHALLDELPHDDPSRLAAQVGHLVIEATSRSSGRVSVREAALRAVPDGVVLEATYDRDGAPWPLTIADRGGEVTVERRAPDG